MSSFGCVRMEPMEIVSDLHLHSKYSRAVSRDMNLQTMALWAYKKGLNVITTGDWTHPMWMREIKQQLVEANSGLFTLKKDNKQSTINNEIMFILSVEISSIYSQGGKVRRIHNLVFAPNIKTAEKINAELVKRGANLSSDGRPIIGLSSEALYELVLSVDEDAIIIPCHAWTPWFSLYGSNSGFYSIDECFGKYAKQIYGVETGLSSDPFMNWQIKELDKRSILSFSDAHSPAKMGREATVFVTKEDVSKFKVSFEDIVLAIKQEPKSKLKIGYTVEFYPEEGKYHFDGHRNCNHVQTPEETKKNGNICPVCKRPITVGVMYRVQQLADKNFDKELFKFNKNGIKWNLDPKKIHPPFVKLVPLNEIIAEALGSTVFSQKTKVMYENLVKAFDTELNVILKADVKEISMHSSGKIAEAIDKVRRGNINIAPGYDGVYGTVKIWNPSASIPQAQNKSSEQQEKQDVSQIGIDF